VQVHVHDRVTQRKSAGPQHRGDQGGAVAEPPEHCAFANTGGGGDVVHGDVLDTFAVEQRSSRGEDRLPVTGGVGAFSLGGAGPR
jgi:hypothetical protein